MKLSTIAISVAVIIGGAAVGGSWYTGKQVEQRYNEIVEMGNHHLKQLAIYGVDAQIKNVKLERHFFSSDVSYQLEVKAEDDAFVFQGNDKLFHGPFPINRLTQGKLTPMLMSAESHISVPEQLKGYFARAELLNAVTHINYSGNASGQFTTSSFKNDQAPWYVSEIAAEFDVEKSGKYDVALKVPSVMSQDDETKVQLEGIEYQLKGELAKHSGYPNLTLGDYVFNLKSIHVTGSDPIQNPDNIVVSFKNLTSKGYAKIQEKRYISEGDGEMDVVMGSKETQTNFGKVKMDMLFTGDASSFDKLYAIYPDLFKNPDNPQVVVEMEKAVQAFLANGVTLNLKHLSLENSKGKSELGLNLNLTLPDFSQSKNLAEILNIFKQSQLTTSLNLASAQELMTQFYALNQQTKANAEHLAKENILLLIDSAQQSGLAKVDAEKIQLKLEIDQGKVKLNGNEVPEEQVQTALFMIALSLGSLGM